MEIQGEKQNKRKYKKIGNRWKYKRMLRKYKGTTREDMDIQKDKLKRNANKCKQILAKLKHLHMRENMWKEIEAAIAVISQEPIYNLPPNGSIAILQG